jgi:hypothetical protein
MQETIFVCSQCEASLPISSFQVTKRGVTAGRRNSSCKPCVLKYNQKWNAAKIKKAPRYWADKALAYYHGLKDDQVKFLLQRLGQRAKNKGVEFSLTERDIVIPKRCPVLGLKLKPAGRGQQEDATVSVDRLNPAKGYVSGNIEIMSLRANRIKNDGTAKEHEIVAAWMRSKGLK